jgi:hypothetical protein
MGNSAEQECNLILAQPCPYKVPPFSFIGGHQFCPCICNAVRRAYVCGYRAAKAGEEPEVGLEVVDPKDES